MFGSTETPAPEPEAAFFAWAALGGVAQILGTACLLHLFQLRSFSTGIVFSKSEVLQVAVFGGVVLGDAITVLSATAILVATFGLVLLAREAGALGFRSALWSLAGRPALLGLATGACFAIAAVGFRAASLSLGLPFAASAAATLAVSILIQSVLIAGYLRASEPGQLTAVMREWRRSLLPGLAEVLFGYAVAIVGLGQYPTRREQIGTALLVVAILGLLYDRAG